jgi:3-isopropylmalate/(R)-2-methylmalate dehydratase large subunit
MKKSKIPTKGELLRLQRQFKTDEKIGERLGGVPAYLVAYWRRKKDVPKYSLPKFSEADIRNLWERYGDDEKAGLELGISKAAFYNWRRRYGLREKPAFLKLEQLELNFPGMLVPSHANSLYGKRSVAQKVLARLLEVDRVEVGQEVDVEPDLTITPDLAAAVVEAFGERADQVWNPSKVVLLPGRSVTDGESRLADAHRKVREFARRRGIKYFYDLQEGNCAQVALERGHIVPGSLILGTGRESLALGALAGMAISVQPTALADVWAGETYHLTVPESARMTINGRRSRGVTAIDVALFVIKQLAGGDVNDKVIEFTGSVVSQMTVGERFTLSGLSGETGARAALCTYDATTRRYLTGRALSRYQPVVADKDTEYAQLYQINVDHLTPMIAPLKSLSTARPVSEMCELQVQHIVLGGLAAGRFEDLRVAAEILRGHHVHDGCRFWIVPGSRSVYLEALRKGLIRLFTEAGAIVAHPGSVGGLEALAPGERGLVTTWPGAVQPANAEIFFCSPAVAAASALNAAITDPTGYGR